MRVTRGGLAVLALVEKQAGLLPAPRIDIVSYAGFAHADGLWHRAVYDLHLLLQAFEQPHFRVVARQHALGFGEFDQ